MSGSSAICANRTNVEPSGYTPKLSHITSKGMKPKSNPKGKKSIVHSEQREIRQKSLPEWKMIKSLDSETTKLKSLQARFGFNGENIEITEFKVEGSVESESGCLNHKSKRLSVESEKVAVVEDVDMIMVSGFGLVENGSSNNNLSHQEDRPPLMEQPPNQHEESYNQMSSMDFEVRSIAQANLKQIEPKIHPKKTVEDGDVLPPDKRDVVDSRISERDMQMDKGGDVSKHPL